MLGSEIVSDGKKIWGLTFIGDRGGGLETVVWMVGLLGSSPSESEGVLPELPLCPENQT